MDKKFMRNPSTKSPGRNFAKQKSPRLHLLLQVFCEMFGKILIPCLECRVIASHRSKKDLESERHGNRHGINTMTRYNRVK